MPLQLGTEPPAWLMDEIKWRRGISSQFTKELLGGVALGGEVLQQKQQRQALQNQADEQARMNQDMESFPVWMQQHDNDPTGYVPKSNWGHQASQQAWQQKYQRGIVDLRREQADSLMDWRESQAELNRTRQENMVGTEKAMLESDKRFLKALDLLPDQRAEILGPEGLKGHFNSDQWTRLKSAFSDAGMDMPSEVDYDAAVAKRDAKQAATGDSEPRTKVVGGITFAWMPGSKGLHVVRPDGTKTELTPSQAEKIADQPGVSKEDRSFFRQYSIAKGKELTRGFEATPEPAKPEAPKTAGFFDRIGDWFKSSKAPPSPAQTMPMTPPSDASGPSPKQTMPMSPPHDEEADRPAQPMKSIPKVKNQADIDKAIDQANKALQGGADRDWVLNRLKELGVRVKE